MRHYHHDDFATQLLGRSLDLLTHKGYPSANENSDSITGDELGAVDLGWTGLCNDVIARYLCVVQRGSSWTFAPFDIGLEWYELELPAQGIHIRFDRHSGDQVNL